MFSHYINNPNNLIVTNDDFYTIPFGQRCTSALACKYANVRNFSLPFDWTIPLFPSKIKKVLEYDFYGFIPDVHNNHFDNIYDIGLAHFNPDIEKGVNEYKRRIDRFNYIMNDNKKKYFVYINEDYLYDDNYRNDHFNDTIFNEMLDLEEFLKEKYINIDYTILYFNFKFHNIPSNSKIINIMLHTENFYDSNDNVFIIDFRKYCGKILAELFNTNINLNFDFLNDYNN